MEASSNDDHDGMDELPIDDDMLNEFHENTSHTACDPRLTRLANELKEMGKVLLRHWEFRKTMPASRTRDRLYHSIRVVTHMFEAAVQGKSSATCWKLVIEKAACEAWKTLRPAGQCIRAPTAEQAVRSTMAAELRGSARTDRELLNKRHVLVNVYIQSTIQANLKYGADFNEAYRLDMQPDKLEQLLNTFFDKQ